MLEYPLQSSYLIAGNPQSCVQETKKQLEELFANNPKTLQIDPVIKDKFLIEDAHELSRRGRQQAGDEVWCLLRGFSRTSQEAQNAVLKILEEPAEGTHFFFITPSPNQLLETVRSRMARKDICSNNQTSNAHADDFLQADMLSDRLSVAEKVVADNALRQFVEDLQQRVDQDEGGFNALRKALVTAAPWLEDVGRSDKQIAEFLAIAAEQDSA